MAHLCSDYCTALRCCDLAPPSDSIRTIHLLLHIAILFDSRYPLSFLIPALSDHAQCSFYHVSLARLSTCSSSMVFFILVRSLGLVLDTLLHAFSWML